MVEPRTRKLGGDKDDLSALDGEWPEDIRETDIVANDRVVLHPVRFQERRQAAPAGNKPFLARITEYMNFSLFIHDFSRRTDHVCLIIYLVSSVTSGKDPAMRVSRQHRGVS